jgi:predicted nucleotidyltransferase
LRFGLTDDEFLLLKEKLIDPLKTKGARVYIFGSRATGNHQRFSDVDILYDDLSKKIEDDFIYILKSSLEDSDFPYKIDLVNIVKIAASYWPSIDAQKTELD